MNHSRGDATIRDQILSNSQTERDRDKKKYKKGSLKEKDKTYSFPDSKSAFKKINLLILFISLGLFVHIVYTLLCVYKTVWTGPKFDEMNLVK